MEEKDIYRALIKTAELYDKMQKMIEDVELIKQKLMIRENVQIR